jgi:FAD synthase
MVIWKRQARQSCPFKEAGRAIRFQCRWNSAGYARERRAREQYRRFVTQVEAGDLAKAAEMLGREYTILGTVVRGESLGKKIGFPTANLSAHSEQFPQMGSISHRPRCKEQPILAW